MENVPNNPSGVDLSGVVRAAAKKTEFLDTLRNLLAAAQEDALRLGLSCRACGACCDFTAMDHRLFVSTGELALLASVRPPHRPVKLQCPYRQGNLCSARDRRPLGCRIFYCDSSVRESLHDLYETYHRRLIALHREWGIPYAYAELTTWLETYRVEFGPIGANRASFRMQVFF